MHRIIKTVCAIAAEDIGRDKADIIAKIAQKRYEELLLENKSDSKALRAHSFKRIYPSIAVYGSLKSAGIGSEKAVWYIRNTSSAFPQRPCHIYNA